MEVHLIWKQLVANFQAFVGAVKDPVGDALANG